MKKTQPTSGEAKARAQAKRSNAAVARARAWAGVVVAAVAFLAPGCAGMGEKTPALHPAKSTKGPGVQSAPWSERAPAADGSAAPVPEAAPEAPPEPSRPSPDADRAPAQAPLSPCPEAPVQIAAEFLQAWADGMHTPLAKPECWVEGLHPHFAYEGRQETETGARPAPVAVDDARPFTGLQVRKSPEAPTNDGPYVARFKWRTIGPAGAEESADGFAFYVTRSRSSGSCALVHLRPRTPALRPSCRANRPAR